MATKHIEDTPALNRAGAYVIVDLHPSDPRNPIAGKILFAYPKDGAGILRASMWDFTNYEREVQNGRATGYGYDKKSAAISGMKFGKGDREFILECDGTGIQDAEKQFAAHGYLLRWVV